MTDVNESFPIKEILTVASPLIKSIVDVYITPKLESLKKKFNKDYNVYHVPTEEHFSEYFHRTYKRLSIVNTLVFNNSQRLLKDIYIPLTIRTADEKTMGYKINKYPKQLLDRFEKILITDTAGMGKSTLMKMIFLDIIDCKIGVPIIVELRRLTKEKTILKEIQSQINSIEKDFDGNLLLELVKEGGFIFILDGYDEIALADREIATRDLQNFIGKAVNNKFILTSRPEKALVSFGDFEEFSIEPLNKKEAFELLRKYDNNGQTSKLLIKKLEEKEMSNISEFLTNPLLVSLLFTAFQYKQAIPFKKYLFYRQVYDANFEAHDLTKGDSYSHDKYTKLEIDDFHRVLRHLGFSCFKIQKIEFDKDELLNLIREGKDFCVGLEFKESDFLNDLLITVPLFTQDGNYYRWAHKSLQEYFAAQFIYLDSKQSQISILNKIYNHEEIEKFYNILDLYYDMDYKSFRNVILLALLKLFEVHDANYLKNVNANIDKNEIILRKELCFLNESSLFMVNQIGDENVFEDEKLEKMINRVYTSKEKRNLNGIYMSHIVMGNIACLNYSDTRETILNILIQKKQPIVSLIPHIDEKTGAIKINYNFKKAYQLVQITGKENDPFNSEENFAVINKFLLATKFSGVKINRDEAIKELRKIEISIKNEQDNNFLLGDF